MKSAIALALVLLTSSLFADTYRLKDSLCGEIDPFVIGDACVVVLENKAEELVIVMDQSDFVQAEFYDLDKSFVSRVDRETAREYRQVLDRNLTFRRGAKFMQLDIHDALVPTAVEQAAIKFSCKAEGAGDGFLDAYINISGTLNKTQEFSKLTELKFDYKLLDGDSVWSQGHTTYESLLNTVAYRPQVYVGMEKFNFYFYDRAQHGYGEFDIILPAKEMLAGKKEFYAYVIMTAIDDHHGDTA